MNDNVLSESTELAPESCFGSKAMRRICSILLLWTSLTGVAVSETEEELLDCLIEPWVVSRIGSPAQGVISSVFVDRGDEVTAGQPLAQLESGVESAEVALATARADARSEVSARQAELQLAELEDKRVAELYRQKLITTQQRDESSARLKIATAALEQATENLAVSTLELKRSQRIYARGILTSPFDGVVVEVSKFPGEFVYDDSVMTVAALDELRVEVMLPARYFGTIAVGDMAQVYPELHEGTPLESTVDVVDATLDSRSGTFGVRLKLVNPSRSVAAGQRCQMKFEPVVAAATPD